jgi:hypothetical protein
VRRFDSYGFINCVKIAYKSSRVYTNNSHHKYFKGTDNNKDSDDEDDDADICYKISKSSISNNNNNNNNKHRVRENSSDHEDSNCYEWFNVTVPSLVPTNNSIKVRFYNDHIDLKDLVGFNNTGNICMRMCFQIKLKIF